MNFRRMPTGVVALILLTSAAADGPAKPAADVPAKNFTNSVEMQFIKIPAGEFQMGITENDAARLVQRGNVDWPLGEWEKQVHKLKLTKDYYIGKHEVTVGQFRKFVQATKYETNAEDGFNAVRTTVIEGAVTVGTWRDPQFKQGEDHPVVCVTSVDAEKFIDWLNKTDKKKPEGCEYRLPTEAEWEYASRGSQGTKYPWGNEWSEQCARPVDAGKLPLLPGKAPVFCIVTKVDTASETYSYFLLCDDFEGLHPVYREMLAQDTSIIEVEKPKGLRVEGPSQQLEALKAETAVFAGPQELPEKAAADLGVGVKMELVLIPAGKFKMGSGESAEDTAAYFNKTYRENFPPDGMGGLEANFFENEHPQHDVRITKPFYVGMYPVTRGQFRQFVTATAYKTDKDKDKKLLAWGWDPDKKQFSNDEKYSWQNAGFEQTEEHPVVNVTWNDAMAFCKWLSEKEGQTYRLPTESEWEYACRARTTTRYPSGDDPQTLGKVSNLVDATVKARIPDWKYMIYHSDNYAFTSPVGKSKPNTFGLHDMHGNAFQWCSDWYSENYYAASPENDPPGPDSGTERVIRGGTWNFRPLGARSAERNKTEPDSRNCSAGFRVVRTQ